MRVVFASHSAQVGVFRVGSHHLSREVARQGHQVAHVSSPVTPAHLAKVNEPDVRSRFRLALAPRAVQLDGVAHVIPLVAWPLSRTPARVANAQLALVTVKLRRFVKPDLLVIDQPLLGGLMDVLKPRRTLYRPTDAHFSGPLRKAELKILERANAIVATSESVWQEVTKSGVGRSLPHLVLENGVEFDRFSMVPTGLTERCGVVYLGALDDRFDWQAVTHLANRFPQETFTLAGPIVGQLPQLPPNVLLAGGVAYSDAAQLLSRSVVGLLPFSAHPANQGRSPMKYYEYLAAGLNVVGTRSAELSRRTAPGVWLYSDNSSAVEALGTALNSVSPNSAGVDHARSFSWAARASDLMSWIEATL